MAKSMSKTFAQYVLSTYGKSVYQIKLEVAAAFFVAHRELGPREAWEAANGFITEMIQRKSQHAPPSASTHPGSLASSAFRPGSGLVEPTE